PPLDTEKGEVMRRSLLSLAAAALVVAGLMTAPPALAADTELITDPGAEIGAMAPQYWSDGSWGTSERTLTWSDDAHSGTHSLRAEVTTYAEGDAKWTPQLSPVAAGEYYTYSDWYKSDRSSAVSVYYEKSDGTGVWANLFSGVAPAAQWTQYTTGFTMPAGAV